MRSGRQESTISWSLFKESRLRPAGIDTDSVADSLASIMYELGSILVKVTKVGEWSWEFKIHVLLNKR